MTDTASKEIEKAFKKKVVITRTREEIEVKFIVPKKILPPPQKWVTHFKAEKYYIEQFYLSPQYFKEILAAYPELRKPSEPPVNEIRLRQKNDLFIITAKGSSTSKKKYIRSESEKTISEAEFNSLKPKAFCNISKNRICFETKLAGSPVHVDMDDYIATWNGGVNLDYVTCEVEVPDDKLAKILISGKFFIPDLIFLRQGIHTVHETGFSNREIAEKGFPAPYESLA